MGKKNNRKAHPPEGAHKKGVVEIKPNPFQHMPSDDELVTAVRNFPSPYQWALTHASTGQQQFLNDDDRVEKITGWCRTAERIDLLLQEAAPNVAMKEELGRLGLDPVKLWLYMQEEAPARLVFHLLKEEAENFHPFVLEEKEAGARAKAAIKQVEDGISEYLLADFRRQLK